MQRTSYTRIAADGVRFFATAIPLKFILGIEYPVAIAILAVIALLYTYAGGVRGVIWVDAVQMVIYIGGALLAAALLVSSHPGGWAGITQLATDAGKFQVFTLGLDAVDWGGTLGARAPQTIATLESRDNH